MKTLAIALDSFAHGARMYIAGDAVEATPGDMADLIKNGLVKAEDAAPQTGVTDSQDDLLGGEKMAEEVQNKMEAAPANKAAPAPKKKH